MAPGAASGFDDDEVKDEPEEKEGEMGDGEQAGQKDQEGDTPAREGSGQGQTTEKEAEKAQSEVDKPDDVPEPTSPTADKPESGSGPTQQSTETAKVASTQAEVTKDNDQPATKELTSSRPTTADEAMDVDA